MHLPVFAPHKLEDVTDLSSHPHISQGALHVEEDGAYMIHIQFNPIFLTQNIDIYISII